MSGFGELKCPSLAGRLEGVQVLTLAARDVFAKVCLGFQCRDFREVELSMNTRLDIT